MNITIVGGGFGGVKTALKLAKETTNKITLITDKPDFQYYPAMYGAATGHSARESWIPLSVIFAHAPNITVQLDTITAIDPAQKVLTGKAGTQYHYETCVLALGAVTTYFGIEGLDRYSYGIKSASEIEALKEHIYTDVVKRHMIDKHYVVVGAGPTGVELAADLGEYVERLGEHHGVKSDMLHIDLVEAAPRILPKMHEKVSAKVTKRLQKLGVNIQVAQAVESAGVDFLMVGGKRIESHTVIWTSGVANHPFFKENAAHFTFAPNHRVVVDEYMMATKDVYVIGDNAATPFTGLAQTALHDARFIAKNFRRTARGKSRRPYSVYQPPVVVPVGGFWAVFEWHGLRLYSWIGELLRYGADIIGYWDVLPLSKALGVWKERFVRRESDLLPATIDTDSSKTLQ